MEVVGHLDRVIPKLCTNIQVSLVNERFVVMSMVYSDGGQQRSLIERVTIDIEHAKNLVEVLNKVIK